MYISAFNWDVSGYLEVSETLEPSVSYAVSSTVKFFDQHAPKEQFFPPRFHLFHQNCTQEEPAPALEAFLRPEMRTQSCALDSYGFGTETAAGSSPSLATQPTIPRPPFQCIHPPCCLQATVSSFSPILLLLFSLFFSHSASQLPSLLVYCI